MHFKPQQQSETPSIKAGYLGLPPPPALFTVKQFAERNLAFSESALWNIRFKSKPRQSSRGPIETNGAASAFVTIGRKVLVDEKAFFEWVRQQNEALK
ncbi:hypothetical protein [Nitrosospira sp. Nsp13]|uniref:hypothetical protein n=1 Tax=Nitrosospira sp. Nsp13 TaxID=1855332 RepID=UPI00088546A4|nr:hypothetical protein [Nitrosospira sp. Nsp13]SCY38235.1 hypothetical protein SAMN05216308_10991 [Nitrosospira sp. Nsp13]